MKGIWLVSRLKQLPIFGIPDMCNSYRCSLIGFKSHWMQAGPSTDVHRNPTFPVDKFLLNIEEIYQCHSVGFCSKSVHVKEWRLCLPQFHFRTLLFDISSIISFFMCVFSWVKYRVFLFDTWSMIISVYVCLFRSHIPAGCCFTYHLWTSFLTCVFQSSIVCPYY